MLIEHNVCSKASFFKSLFVTKYFKILENKGFFLALDNLLLIVINLFMPI